MGRNNFLDWNQTYFDSNGNNKYNSKEFRFRINNWFDGDYVKNNGSWARQTEWFNGMHTQNL